MRSYNYTQQSDGRPGGCRRLLFGVFSSCLGAFIAMAAVTALAVIVVVSLVGGGDDTSTGDPPYVLRISLAGDMSDRDTGSLALFGDDSPAISLEKILKAIEWARDDDKVAGISLECGALLAQPAAIEELHHALLDFKRCGKFVYAYASHYTQGCYVVATAADTVVLNPVGEVDWKGLSSLTVYYTDLMARLGVGMQVFKVGSYKSAVEPYTATRMSDANRRQVSSYVNDIWQGLSQMVATARHIHTDSLRLMADNYMGLDAATDIHDRHMVDTLMYHDEYEDFLRARLGRDADDDIAYTTPTALAAKSDAAHAYKANIAVLYAEGEIVDNPEMGLLASAAIDPTTIGEALKQITDDDDIKAVVLRVNSGGGSAFASEQIWHQFKRLSATKPLVVSMGGMAASGAYYISMGASHVVAQPTTLTGSIGIFAMVPDVSQLLADKLYLHFDNVKTNAMADMGDMSRPFSEAEAQRMQDYVDRGYDLFLRRVADARGLTRQEADSLAQGRVWTGRQALDLHLVDTLGSLSDAIAIAARLANVSADDVHTRDYPELQPWYSSLGLSLVEAAAMRRTLCDIFGDYAANAHEMGALLHPLSLSPAQLRADPHPSMVNLLGGARWNSLQARIPYIINIK